MTTITITDPEVLAELESLSTPQREQVLQAACDAAAVTAAELRTQMKIAAWRAPFLRDWYACPDWCTEVHPRPDGQAGRIVEHARRIGQLVSDHGEGVGVELWQAADTGAGPALLLTIDAPDGSRQAVVLPLPEAHTLARLLAEGVQVARASLTD